MRIHMRTTICGTGVILLLAITAGCSGSNSNSASTAGAPAASREQGGAKGAAQGDVARGGAAGRAQPVKLAPAAERAVIYTADLRVRAKNVSEAAAMAKQLVAGAGGYV